MDITLIGAGNLATSLAPALRDAGHVVRQVYSRTMTSAELLAKRVGAEATDDLNEVRPTADVYVFSVKDAVLEQLVAQVAPRLAGKVLLHTAGSMPMDLFRPYAGHYGVFYPMQTFSKNRPVSFSSIPCFIEANDEQTLATALSLAHSVSKTVCQLSSADRKYLHLSAVFACNFVNHCYAMADQLLSKHGIPFDVLLPLIDETARKVHSLSPHDAQTGPAVRYDRNVLSAQENLLDDERMKAIYRLMSEDIHESHQ